MTRTRVNDAKAPHRQCQTCHQGWNEDVMEDVPQPYRRHPLPALLALHKPEIMGCTTCHRGQGTALTAATAHGEGDPFWRKPAPERDRCLGVMYHMS